MRAKNEPSVTLTPLLKTLAAVERQATQTINEYHQIGKAYIGPLTGSTMAAPNAVCPVDTTNEFTFQVTFNNTFLEEPVATFGLSLDPGSASVPGHFPTYSAHVLHWQTDTGGDWGEQPGSLYGAYLGATVGVSVTGQVGQVLWLHYHFVGRAQAYSNAPAATATNQLTSGTTTSSGAPVPAPYSTV